jgi:hypothetical protein
VSIITALRNGVTAAWLTLIRYANWLAGFATAGALALNTTHPEVITAVENTLPPWARMGALLVWCAFIEFLVQRAKGKASA